MAMTTAMCHSIALLFFNNTALANWGDATGLPASAGAGSVYGGLHSADPGLAGNQTTSELSYTGYNASARPGLARSSAGWTVGTGGAVSNAAAMTWGACTAGSGTCTYLGLGFATSSTGNLFCTGSTNNLSISAGITPSAAIGAITWTLS